MTAAIYTDAAILAYLWGFWALYVIITGLSPRRAREAVLGIDNGWLQNINNQISDLRVQL